MAYPPPPPQPGQPPYGQYPPQPPYGQQAPYGQYPAPPRNKSNGCLIAGLIFLVIMLVLCGVGGFALWKLYDTVKDSVPGLGGAECPTEEDVSDLVGVQVELELDADIIVASGCNYSGNGVGVVIVEGAGVIADEQIKEFRTAARSAGTEAESIEVGDDGLAFGSPQRSQAITKNDGTVVQVEIFGANGQNIGNKKSEAIELLEIFIDLN